MQRLGVRIGDVLHGSEQQPLRDGLRLPAGTSQLQIDYVALSLARPERNRYRYRLSGVDDGWQDAGSSTRAYYTNLAPGNYRFEVEAANEDGIWSTAPASRSTSMLPTISANMVAAGAMMSTIWLPWIIRLKTSITTYKTGRPMIFLRLSLDTT